MNTEQIHAHNAGVLVAALLAVLWSGCTEQSGAAKQKSRDNLRATVSDEGRLTD